MPTDIPHSQISQYHNIIDVNTGNQLVINTDGSINTTSITTGTSATVSRVAVGIAAVTLLAAKPNRISARIFNEVGTLHIKLGSAATHTDYSIELLASAGNNSVLINDYSGIITAIKVSGSTFVQVTEI